MPSSGVQTCALDRKSTRLNSSHLVISYAVFCLKNKQISQAWSPAACSTTLAPWKCSTGRYHPGVFISRMIEADGEVELLDKGVFIFFFNETATPEIYTLSLHDALPIYSVRSSISSTATRYLPYSLWRFQSACCT